MKNMTQLDAPDTFAVYKLTYLDIFTHCTLDCLPTHRYELTMSINTHKAI